MILGIELLQSQNNSAVPAIEITDLRFSYAGANDNPVLDICAWTVHRGQQLFLQGPSGCGKSTLLNLLAGVLMPDRGDIRLLGHSLTGLSSRQRDQFRARHIGVVFQQFNLIPYLCVIDNIRLAAHFANRPCALLYERIQTLFERLQLSITLLSRRADMLSVGQQQRVAIVRALINTPEILIVDEPTSALDADASDAFMALLLELSRDNSSTLVFVSHDKSLAQYFDENLCLQNINSRVEASDAR